MLLVGPQGEFKGAWPWHDKKAGGRSLPLPFRDSAGPECRATRADGRPCASCWSRRPACSVMDIGLTSPANIHYLTRLGHSVFLADVVHDACTGNWQTGMGEDGKPVWNIEGFLDQSLDFSGRKFDVVLLWTTLDYLPEALVAPVVARLFQGHQSGRAGAGLLSHPDPGRGDGVTAAFTSPKATTSRCSWPSRFPFSAPSATAASSGSSPTGPGTASFWPRTASRSC